MATKRTKEILFVKPMPDDYEIDYSAPRLTEAELAQRKREAIAKSKKSVANQKAKK